MPSGATRLPWWWVTSSGGRCSMVMRELSGRWGSRVVVGAAMKKGILHQPPTSPYDG